MITPNCRHRFTAEDFEFVVRTLSRSEGEAVSLVELLTEEETRDAILDSPRLAQSLADSAQTLRISPQLYFYLLVRHALKGGGLDDRRLSDYVAALLAHFSHTARMRSPADGRDGPIQYVSDMLIALRDASPSQQFFIRAHVGNYALFLSGIFVERVASRAQRGGPGVGFYEEMGRANFRAAADSRVAREVSLSALFDQLAETFHDVRVALNRMADTRLHLDEPPGPVLARPD